MRFSKKKNTQISNFMEKKGSVGADFFLPCGRTDMTKLMLAFRNIANAPNLAIQKVQIKGQCRKHFITLLSCSVGKHCLNLRESGKSLARPGRKQANVSVRMA